MSLKEIIAYNVGYGDCILLHFENESHINEKYYLLVDFGIRKNTSNQQISSILTSHRESKNGDKQDLIEIVGNQIARIVNGSNMDILVTHFHEDHYNGINRASAFENLNIKKIFVSRKDIPNDLIQFINFRKITIDYLEKKDDYTIYQYPNGQCEKINILWPNKVFDKLSNKQNFLDIQFPNWHQINEVPPSPGLIGEHDTCLVFEVKGINDKWCLFAGDASDKFNAYITNSILVDEPGSCCELFPLLSSKYLFIKAPHHGTESWPLKAAASNCEVLITMADTGDKSTISPEYFSNTSITKIYMMNCMNCNGKGINGACSKCTVSPNQVNLSQIINL
ncbi:hypothetical protein K9O30_06160 [Clostridium bowmanii]|uniref:hypothetical protein n=1 Tax=Clostridium bowmanii TaxID=132925 RepID=UPI001C0B5300|nr:hypothetical protein [Clostridium bowmanii]MBU3188744.1 hypothetical protein [Clostridium bowmanii]MCA1073329.1 hypothetical protein [Clostridium bowmanii]